MKTLQRFHIGVDLGQKRDHTAVVIVEQRLSLGGDRDPVTFAPRWTRHLIVGHVEQVKLGTAYAAVFERVHELTHRVELSAGLVTICVDATGIGQVVVESLERRGLRGELIPVVFTGGRNVRYTKGSYTVPKQELMQGLALLLEKKELSVAEGVREWGLLRAELLSMRGVAGTGGTRYECAGVHDDLVMALGLACFGMRQRLMPLRGPWTG